MTNVLQEGGRALWNPYLDYFKALPAACRRNPFLAIDPREAADPIWLRFKTAVATHYSWAVPTDEAIFLIAGAARRVVEIGAGSGYWAWLMAQAGIDVIAYDAAPPAAVWHPVWPGDELAVLGHGDRTLLLCWPPFGTEMAANALAAYAGDQVVYVGEWLGGSANPRFFGLLAGAFEEVASVALPQWTMRTDRLSVHRRR
jgi:hypothetical protein